MLGSDNSALIKAQELIKSAALIGENFMCMCQPASYGRVVAMMESLIHEVSQFSLSADIALA